jgi:dTDP-4-amino-4,6-dideoxygalactose transaminase
MDVPYFDLTLQYVELRAEILEAIDRVCGSGIFVLGEEVEQFEKEFAAYCGVNHCVAVNSGTSALHLALLVAGVQAGDEVITTPNTFLATAEAILYTGARPVFADIDPATANIDPQSIEAAITPRTKAILPVHLYGQPVDFDAISAVAAKYHLAVIEDACQAHGARYRGRRVGSLGSAAAFSFYPTKNLGAYGEGGALTTNDARAAALARALRHHGQRDRYEQESVGYNYRLDSLQCAVLRIKLKRLDAWTQRRRYLVDLYRQHLHDARVELLRDLPEVRAVYHLFVVYVDDRDRVRAELAKRGVGTAVHYPRPLHLQPALAHLGYGPGSFPHAERACERVLSLPLYPELTEAQVEYVARSLREIVGSR